MFDKRLRHAEHIRHYSITSSEESGWEVRLEEDDTLRRHTYYQDWHRVERAMARFAKRVPVFGVEIDRLRHFERLARRRSILRGNSR